MQYIFKTIHILKSKHLYDKQINITTAKLICRYVFHNVKLKIAIYQLVDKTLKEIMFLNQLHN